jgi:hypothetical protein
MRYNAKGTLIAPPQISAQLGIFRREDGMAARLSIARAAAVVALLALGCKKDPDPSHFKLAGINSGPQLTDTLWRRVPYGTREAAVWSMMQGNGFYCGESGVTPLDFDTTAFGTRDLRCSRSTRINFGLKRREFWVFFHLDSGRVTGINTLSFKQDM